MHTDVHLSREPNTCIFKFLLAYGSHRVRSSLNLAIFSTMTCVRSKMSTRDSFHPTQDWTSSGNHQVNHIYAYLCLCDWYKLENIDAVVGFSIAWESASDEYVAIYFEGICGMMIYHYFFSCFMRLL